MCCALTPATPLQTQRFVTKWREDANAQRAKAGLDKVYVLDSKKAAAAAAADADEGRK
jgi:hypothetical protein